MPEITEEALYAAFGLEAPASTGGNEQEPAAPATEPADRDGGNEQEVAEPAEETGSPEENGAQRAEDNAPQQELPGNEPMTPEQRRANAARRREQEQREAIDKAVNERLEAERKAHAEDMKTFFAQMGMKNSVTGQPITTMDEFWEWKRGYDLSQLDTALKSGSATAEQIGQLIDSHPAVQQAQQLIRESRQQQEAQQQSADQQRIDSDLAEIAKLNPNIRSVTDLLAMPKYETFKGHVEQGMSFLNAYKLTHMEELTNAKAAAATQQALNNQRGKDHLTPAASGRGSGAQAVPASVMAYYRAFNPKATEAEIQAHYNKQLKKS